MINLEREDRQFLKKAEKLLPKIQNKKASVKKSIEEKSYYLWLNFYLEEIKIFNESFLQKNKVSVWSLLIEEELKLLKELKPVMGLPDTLKAKNLFEIRKELISKSHSKYEANNIEQVFDFSEIFSKSEKEVSKSWKSITEKDPESNKKFPIIDSKNVEDLRSEINQDLRIFMSENYPSLKEDL